MTRYCSLCLIAGSKLPEGTTSGDTYRGQLELTGDQLRFRPAAAHEKAPWSPAPDPKRPPLYFWAGPEPLTGRSLKPEVSATALVGPAGEDDCHLWDGADGSHCPASASCPYRDRIARCQSPDGAAEEVTLRVVADELPRANLFLLARNLSGPRDQAIRPSRLLHPDGTPYDLCRLPPTAVPDAEDVLRVGSGPTHLRRALLRQVAAARPLRADALVAARDCPGPRDLLAAGALERLDLAETAVAQPAAPPRYTLVIRLHQVSDPALREGVLQPWTELVAADADKLDLPRAWVKFRIEQIAKEAAPFLSLSAPVIRIGPAEDGRTLPGLRIRDPGHQFYRAEPFAHGLPAPLPAALAGDAAARLWVEEQAAALPDSGARRDRLLARLFDAVLGAVPPWFLAPWSQNRWPSELFRWWLERRAVFLEDPNKSLSAAEELAHRLSVREVTTPLIAAGRTLGRRGPLQFIFGRSLLAGRGLRPIPPEPLVPWGRILDEVSVQEDARCRSHSDAY